MGGDIIAEVTIDHVAIDQQRRLEAMKRATGRTSDALDLERLREALGELPGDRM
jgi:hypothetical protein